MKEEPSGAVKTVAFIAIGIFIFAAVTGVVAVYSSETTGIFIESSKWGSATVKRWVDPGRFYADELAALVPAALVLLVVVGIPVVGFWRRFSALTGPEDRRPKVLPKDDVPSVAVSKKPRKRK